MYVCVCLGIPHGDALQHHGWGVGHATHDSIRAELSLYVCKC